MQLHYISKDFLVDNVKKTGLYGYLYDFLANYDSIDPADVLDIHQYLMKKYDMQ